MYNDRTLNCRDCGQSFVFTTGEQEFFASRGFTNEPSRCPECRAQRKQSQGGSFSGNGAIDTSSSAGKAGLIDIIAPHGISISSGSTTLNAASTNGSGGRVEFPPLRPACAAG